MRTQAPLGENTTFQKLWLGQVVSTTGDAFCFVAMPLLVLEATHSVVQMGVVTAVGAAGQMIMGVASGVVVDRVHRRRLMIACDLARLFLFSLLPLSWWFGWRSLWLIYVVAGLAAALGNLFAVSCLAAVANIVAPKDIGPANSRLQATQALTYVTGALLAGVFCEHLGAAAAVLVNAGSFGASATVLATAKFGHDLAPKPARHDSSSVVSEFLDGLRFLFRHGMLRALLLFQVAIALLASAGLGAAIIDLVVFRLRVDLGQSARAVGVCLGLAALGSVLGALAAIKLRKSVGFGKAAICATVAQAAGLLLAGFGHGPGAVTGGAMLWASGLTLRGVAANAMRQTLAPDAILDRVTAASYTLVYGAGAIGAVVVTHLAAARATSIALIYVGAALAIIAAVGAISPLSARSIRVE